jgi:hypothetical protein
MKLQPQPFRAKQLDNLKLIKSIGNIPENQRLMTTDY